jgi:hypothetical protein
MFSEISSSSSRLSAVAERVAGLVGEAEREQIVLGEQLAVDLGIAVVPAPLVEAHDADRESGGGGS